MAEENRPAESVLRFRRFALAVCVIGVLVQLGITAYYLGNHLFWGKMGILAVMLILEVAPMVTLIRWRRLHGAGQPVAGAAGLPSLATAREPIAP